MRKAALPKGKRSTYLRLPIERGIPPVAVSSWTLTDSFQHTLCMTIGGEHIVSVPQCYKVCHDLPLQLVNRTRR